MQVLCVAEDTPCLRWKQASSALLCAACHIAKPRSLRSNAALVSAHTVQGMSDTSRSVLWKCRPPLLNFPETGCAAPFGRQISCANKLWRSYSVGNGPVISGGQTAFMTCALSRINAHASFRLLFG